MTTLSLYYVLFAFVVFFTLCNYGMGSSVRIDVTTQYHDDVFPDAFNIRCSWETHGNCAKTIVLLKISKDADKTIAGIQRDNSIFYGSLPKSSVRADGHIDSVHNNMTSFSISITDAMKEDSGLYSCTAHYIDANGNLGESKSSANVTINDQDCQDVIRHLLLKVALLENVIEFQKNDSNMKIASLEKKVDEQGKELKQTMSSMIDELKAQGLDHNRQIQAIVAKDTYHTAFSVYGTKEIIKTGETLRFKYFILNRGGDYNMATGIFTAPKSGLYVFHLSVWATSGDYVHVNLKVDDVIRASLVAQDSVWYTQSAISTVMSLDAGNKVWPYVGDGGKLAAINKKYTVFNGYLLQQY